MMVHRMLVGASCACRIRHEVFFAMSEILSVGFCWYD